MTYMVGRETAETYCAIELVLGGFSRTPLERDPRSDARSLFDRRHAELAAPALGQQRLE